MLNSVFENELAFDLAKNGIAHPLNTENGCAGKDWMRRFLQRPELVDTGAC